MTILPTIIGWLRKWLVIVASCLTNLNPIIKHHSELGTMIMKPSSNIHHHHHQHQGWVPPPPSTVAQQLSSCHRACQLSILRHSSALGARRGRLRSVRFSVLERPQR